MTVATLVSVESWASSGTLNPRTLPFPFIALDDVLVTYTSVAGAVQTLVRGTDYTITGNNRAGTAVFTPLVEFAAGGSFRAERRTRALQEYETERSTPLSAESVERELDRQALRNQEQDRDAAALATRTPLALPGQSAPAIDVTGLAEGDILTYLGGRLRRLDTTPFAGGLYGGAAVTGRFVRVSGTGADAALRADLADIDGDQLIQTVDETSLRASLQSRVATRSIIASGALGEAVLASGSWTSASNDNAALTALINGLRAATKLYSETGSQDDFTKRGKADLPLDLSRRFLYITEDMPPLPPGTEILGEGCTIIQGANNLRILWWEGGVQEFAKPGGDTLRAYGTDNLVIQLPFFVANGHSGTPVVLATVARSIIKGGGFLGYRGSSYTINCGVTDGSHFVDVDPDDYAQVKQYDSIDLGNQITPGNVQPYLVRDKRVLNPGAGDKTYGKLFLHKAVVKATGNHDAVQMSYPMAMVGFQQCEMHGVLFTENDYTMMFGESQDRLYFNGVTNEVIGGAQGSNTDWLRENLVGIGPSTDMRFYHIQHEHNKNGLYAGGQCAMMYWNDPSLQFNSDGSEAVWDCISVIMSKPRIEIRNDASEALCVIPAMVVTGGCTLEIVGGIDWVHNTKNRYLLGQYDDSTLIVDRIRQVFAVDVPEMPDGTHAMILKPQTSGRVEIGSVSGMSGPTLGGVSYPSNPYAWITDGEGATVYTNYRVGSRVDAGDKTMVHPPFSDPVFSLRREGDAFPWLVFRGDRKILFGDGTAAPTAGFGGDNFGNIYAEIGAPANLHIQRPIAYAFEQVLSGRKDAITAPAGGATIDAEARAAIAAILTVMGTSAGGMGFTDNT